MYLGQYRQGDEVVVPLRAYTATPPVNTWTFADSHPRIRVYKTDLTITLIDDLDDFDDGKQMYAYDHPTFPGYFRHSIFLDDRYSATGSYTVEVSWKYESSPYSAIIRYCPFEILPGGNQDGILTSLAEIVRPDKRFLMAGTTMGSILRRKNPRVAS